MESEASVVDPEAAPVAADADAAAGQGEAKCQRTLHDQEAEADLYDPERPWLGKAADFPVPGRRPRLTKRLLDGLVKLADVLFDPPMEYTLSPEGWIEHNADAHDALLWIYRMRAHHAKAGAIRPQRRPKKEA